MTENEYINSGCENRFCQFTFTDQRTEYGVITTFFNNEPHRYYLVRANQMIDFQRYMNEGNQEQMRLLSSPVDLESIVDVNRVEKLGFKPKALIALQGLSQEEKQAAMRIIQSMEANPNQLEIYERVKISNKSVFVVRGEHKLRIFIQREQFGIIVLDIIRKE